METAYDRVGPRTPDDARHPQAVALAREWMGNHEDKRVFVRQEEIIAYQAALNAFIGQAESTLAAMKGQTLGGVRFADSIAFVEKLIEHAKYKRSFFDSRFAEIGHESNTFARAMTFDEQRMVASFKDFGNITAKMREFTVQGSAMSSLTPSQAWALVAANAKGEVNEWANCELAIRRLQEFNKKWHTTYGMTDLSKTFMYMVESSRVATQYRLERRVGEQQGIADSGTPLYKLLMKSGTFKNMWETGTSQASAEREKRGAVEEQMGYGSALGRKAGTPQDYGDKSSVFEPDKPGEMPRYAATIADAQRSGVATRYGSSYVVWKDSVRQRATWTPGDSWSMGAEGPQSVKNYVSLDYPELIFAHADETLLRMFMAEATGKDTEWLTQAREDHKQIATGGAYIETQIHGELTWSDVDEVVLDPTLPNLSEIRTDFNRFKVQQNLQFTVRTTTTSF